MPTINIQITVVNVFLRRTHTLSVSRKDLISEFGSDVPPLSSTSSESAFGLWEFSRQPEKIASCARLSRSLYVENGEKLGHIHIHLGWSCALSFLLSIWSRFAAVDRTVSECRSPALNEPVDNRERNTFRNATATTESARPR